MANYIPDSSSTTKPLPEISEEALPFWQGARDHRLMMQRCGQCGKYQWFPTAMCRFCQSDRMVWEEADGDGVVYSYTVTHRGSVAAFKTPYVIAIVELPNGVRLMSNIVGCAPDAVKVGMPVKVCFEDWTSEVSVMQFRPA